MTHLNLAPLRGGSCDLGLACDQESPYRSFDYTSSQMRCWGGKRLWKGLNCRAEDKDLHSRILGQQRQGIECTTSGLTEAAIECLEGSSVAAQYWLVHSVALVTVRSTLGVDDKAPALEAVDVEVSSAGL